MDRAGLLPFEKVMVVSLDSGERLETYVIEGARGSGEICLNGAAARKILKGDTVIIIAFVTIDAREYGTFEPVIVHVDANNRIVEEDTGETDDQC
jgi:aspartate 1-decarboxylase